MVDAIVDRDRTRNVQITIHTYTHIDLMTLSDTWCAGFCVLCTEAQLGNRGYTTIYLKGITHTQTSLLLLDGHSSWWEWVYCSELMS